MGRKRQSEVMEQTVAVVPQGDQHALVTFVERLVMDSDSISLPECFAAAADMTAYLTAVRNKSMIAGSRHVPKTVQTIGVKAAEGDLEAAKLLFDFLGLRVKAPVAQINTQVNIQTPTLRDVITIDSEGNIVDGTS